MKKYTLLTLVLGAIIFVGTANADIVYRELFSDDPAGATLVSYAGWNWSRSGTGYDGGTSGTLSSGGDSLNFSGLSVNSNPQTPDPTNPLFTIGRTYVTSYNNDRAFLWTDEYTIAMSDWSDLVISWGHDNARLDDLQRAAIRIGTSWYVSDPGIITTEKGWDGPRVEVDFNQTSWKELGFFPGTLMAIGDPVSQLPAGDITGFGWYVEPSVTSGGSMYRIDTYTIEGVYGGAMSTLTILASPVEAGSLLLPEAGPHSYPLNSEVALLAANGIICPDIFVFDHWIGAVDDTLSASTSITMAGDQTVTAVFTYTTRTCGDACHPYPAKDFNEDCYVNMLDFEIFALAWLECNHPDCD